MKQRILCMLYNILLWPALLFACYKLYWPRKGKLPFGSRWVEHFGFGKSFKSPDLWYHAVSVGEVIASVPLIQALQKRHPKWRVLVTTTTATGAAEVSKRLGNSVEHRYAPFDLWPCIWLFITRYQPKQLWIMETELWLNWLKQCEKRHIPVKLINARLSTRSTKRYLRFASFAQLLFPRLSWIGAQYQHDADHFITVGAPAEHVQVTGSVKYDLVIDAKRIANAKVQRQQLFGNRPVIIAASTHAGEDETILAIAKTLRQEHPSLVLILVPRHPERFDEVTALASQDGPTIRRSLSQPVRADTITYVGDTMGELIDMLAMSDVTIMGGSFTAIGGHNYLEPAALGIPCISGPFDFNFREISLRLQQSGALKLNKNTDILTHQISHWLNDSDAWLQASQAALDTVAANQGAVSRSLAALLADEQTHDLTIKTNRL